MLFPPGCAHPRRGRSSFRPGGRGAGEGRLPLYAFDDVRVDTAAFRVERGGTVIALEPKAFDLLVLLLERPGQLVTKQEILDTVWRQTAVTDNALTRTVAHLRKALGDDAREARYIETVPTRGYRWVATVTRPAEASPVRPPAESRPRSSRLALLGLAALVVAAIVLTVRLGEGWWSARVARRVEIGRAHV